MFPDIIKKVPVRDYGIDGLTTHVDHTPTGTIYQCAVSPLALAMGI